MFPSPDGSDGVNPTSTLVRAEKGSCEWYASNRESNRVAKNAQYPNDQRGYGL